MYTIIGGDGKEYGPVSVLQVRAWIAGGRANLDTKIREDGSDEWKAVADFPELTSTSAPAGPVIAGRAGTLDIIRCFERSWELLKANFWQLLGVSVLVAALACAFFAVQGMLPYMAILSPFLVAPLIGGWYYFFLKRLRGEPATLSDAFGGFTRAYGPLVVAGIVIQLFTFVGLICLVLPGIYLIVAYSFTYILATDKRLPFWDAMETSRRVITRQWWRVLGLILLSIPFLLLGLAAFGIGIFVVLPLVIGAQAYAYEDLCNPPAVQPLSPLNTSASSEASPGPKQNTSTDA